MPMDMRHKLVHELTALDAKEQKRHYNIYRLGIYLNAVDDWTKLVDKGMPPPLAFAQVFTPTRSNHGISRRLGLGLDVVRGHWTFNGEVVD